MTPPKKILVIMLRRIGDVILTTPVARALKKLYPEARIDFLVEPPAHELLAGVTEIDRILVYGKGFLQYPAWLWRVRQERYDWVIDYMGNPRTAVLTHFSGAPVQAGPGHVGHRWAYSHFLQESSTTHYSAQEKIRVLSSLGLEPDEKDCIPYLASDMDAEDEAASLLRKMRIPRGPLIGFAPASRRATRQWPPEHYAALGRQLRDKTGAHILIFWGPGEKGLASRIRNAIGEGAYLAPKTPSLRTLASLIYRCAILITNCNGPKHIAVAREIPTLTIHSSSDPASWNPPDRTRHPIARREDLHCIGCMKNVCPYNLECLNDLKADDVFPLALELLTHARQEKEPVGGDLP